ncbi:MAG: hypothetical protein RIS76_288, partial [Verrucomicrobiota bacterium]
MVLNSPAPTPQTLRPRDEFGAGAVLERIRGSLRRGGRDRGHEVEFQALGTRCRLQLVGTAPNVERFVAAVIPWVAMFEAKYSRYLPGSLISRINAAAGNAPVELDAEAERIFGLCHELHF